MTGTNLQTIWQQIADLKSSRNAVVLAHHFQDDEIQAAADFVGDTFELVEAAKEITGGTVVVCGSKFMAELAKVLSPASIVVLPDLTAGCSLVDSCPAEAIKAFRKSHPDYALVSHINTSVEVKAESDILCTTKNAVAVVNSIPEQQPILFLPDVNLGNWLKKQTARQNMQIWQGACIVHATFPARRLTQMRAEHRDALVAADPGCPVEVLRMADFIGSTGSIVEWSSSQSASEFIICTESGVKRSLEKGSPGKKFHFLRNENCNCSECPYIRTNTLEKLLVCLQTLAPSIELNSEVMSGARASYDRMLQIQ